MDTYQAAYWSDPSYSSSDDEEICYNMYILYIVNLSHGKIKAYKDPTMDRIQYAINLATK